MKKHIIIAITAIVASFGITNASNSFRTAEDHSKCESGMRCNFCKGTGFQGNYNCFHCRGSGRSGSY